MDDFMIKGFVELSVAEMELIDGGDWRNVVEFFGRVATTFPYPVGSYYFLKNYY